MIRETTPASSGRERIERELESARNREETYTIPTVIGLGILAADLFAMAVKVQEHVPLSHQPVELFTAISALALTAISGLQTASSSREAAALKQALAEDTLRRDQLPTNKH